MIRIAQVHPSHVHTKEWVHFIFPEIMNDFSLTKNHDFNVLF